jgi:hypothetical protein
MEAKCNMYQCLKDKDFLLSNLTPRNLVYKILKLVAQDLCTRDFP